LGNHTISQIIRAMKLNNVRIEGPEISID